MKEELNEYHRLLKLSLDSPKQKDRSLYSKLAEIEKHKIYGTIKSKVPTKSTQTINVIKTNQNNLNFIVSTPFTHHKPAAHMNPNEEGG